VTDPDLALLTGPEAADLLRAAVATAGGQVVTWSVRQVDHRPGSSTTASYDVRVRWRGTAQVKPRESGEPTKSGDAGGSGETGETGVTRETLGASIGLGALADEPGILQLSNGESRVAVWRIPQDPGLPGLATATDPNQLANLLAMFGVTGTRAADVRVKLRAYRPRRRAVVEVRSPTAAFFVKVLHPERVEDLHRRHVLLHDAGVPVPRSLGWTEAGLLVLERLSGAPMRSALGRPGAPLPKATEVIDLLDRLPEGVLDLPRRAAWSDNAGYYARVIGAALPSEADRARQLAATITEAVAGAPCDEPTHGDLYEGQLLLGRGGRITGLLDVDTAGPGRRADDLAGVIAHLEVLALMSGAHRERLRDLSRTWSEIMEHRVDPRELRIRVAGVALSLATGPHRVQEAGWESSTGARLDLVERWVARSVGHDS
jgi:hypothetical protein